MKIFIFGYQFRIKFFLRIDTELPSKVSEDAEVINKTFKVNQKLTKRVFRLQKELDDIQTMNKALQHLDEVEEEMKEGFEFSLNLIKLFWSPIESRL